MPGDWTTGESRVFACQEHVARTMQRQVRRLGCGRPPTGRVTELTLLCRPVMYRGRVSKGRYGAKPAAGPAPPAGGRKEEPFRGAGEAEGEHAEHLDESKPSGWMKEKAQQVYERSWHI